MVGDDIHFTAMTHQALLDQLAQVDEPAPDYLRYLSRRYGLR